MVPLKFTGKDTVYFPLHHSDHVKSDSEKKNFWDQMNKKILQNANVTKVTGANYKCNKI